ncbi:MAG TPA: ABC transporter ATP-binding protein [Streptosporangiaceae bacterium]|nr:ABC transporter ATP-binding protein [Streptosporangiaceae bacterium]
MPTSPADGPVQPDIPGRPAAGQGRPAAVLTVTDVVSGYGGPPIVRGVTAQVGAGEIVTIVGPNGAGKSTLLKAIAGLLRAESGRVTLDGADITNQRTNRLARLGLGYVPQSNDVFDPLTVRENLEVGGYRVPRPQVGARIDEVTSLLPALGGLMGRRAAKLSGGERKMVAVGRALMSRPRVLLLDEPTSGLSAERSTQLLTRDIRALAESGASVLLVEQKALAALEISHWGYVLALGRVVISTPAAELLARPDLGEVFLGQVATPEPARPSEAPTSEAMT